MEAEQAEGAASIGLRWPFFLRGGNSWVGGEAKVEELDLREEGGSSDKNPIP